MAEVAESEERSGSRNTTITISPETKAMLRQLARDDGLSMTGMITLLIRNEARRRRRLQVGPKMKFEEL